MNRLTIALIAVVAFFSACDKSSPQEARQPAPIEEKSPQQTQGPTREDAIEFISSELMSKNPNWGGFGLRKLSFDQKGKNLKLYFGNGNTISTVYDIRIEGVDIISKVDSSEYTSIEFIPKQVGSISYDGGKTYKIGETFSLNMATNPTTQKIINAFTVLKQKSKEDTENISSKF